MTAPSDQELVEQVRKGTRSAFTELMRRYQQRVYWTARRIIGSHDEADDIAQETFIRAYLALGDYRGDASFFTWLYRITVNLSLNAVRKRQLKRYLRQSEIVARVFPSPDDPAREVEEREMQSLVERAVLRLPEKQRAVFVMRYYDELSYEEISEVLNTSVGGLKANYFHALRKVQEFIRNEVSPGKAG